MGAAWGLPSAGGGAAGVAVSVGVGYANNDIEDQVKAFVDGSSVTSAGAINLSATEGATIQSLPIGGAIAVAGGGIAGVALAGAGAGTTDTVKNVVQSYIGTSGTITFPTPDGLTTGDEVVYHTRPSAANLPVNGLVDGQVYYAIVLSPTQIKLAATRPGARRDCSRPHALGIRIGAHDRPRVALGHRRVQPLERHPLAQPDQFHEPPRPDTGDMVVYHRGSGNTAPGGLVDGATYYVIRIDSATIRLAATLADAQAGNAIYITSKGAGTGQTLVYTDPKNAKTTDTFGASNVTIDSSKIAFASPHGLSTGEEVVYHNVGGVDTAVGGLLDGHSYYVIRLDAMTIELAATPADVQAGQFIRFLTAGTRRRRARL